MKNEKMKELLLAEKAQLESELGGIAERDADRPEDWEPKVTGGDEEMPADENDLAQNITDSEDNRAILKELEPRLRDVNDALDRIENDTYGICEVCQNPIDEDRLSANPAARTCREHMN